MKASRFLFLGYSMRDWKMRGDGAREVEKKLWSRRGDVDLLYAPLKDYIERVEAELDPAPRP